MKEYRITWRHEVYVLAKNDKQAIEAWESVDLGNLDGDGNRECHGMVEEISFECVSDDYREVSRR